MLFDNNGWPTVCDRHYQVNFNTPQSCADIRRACNPNIDRQNNSKLERGLFIKRGQTTPDRRVLPDRSTIKYLFRTTWYDAPCPEKNNQNGYNFDASGDSFRNRVEGFVAFENRVTGQFKVCGSGPDHNNFHNAVHIYIHGHMRIVPSASNDPIFYLHHANIDRFFEEWLQGMGANANYMPTSRIAHPGHNTEDYLVPFFPLKTNGDMYKQSSEFGYNYEEQDLAQPDAGEALSCSSKVMIGF